MGEVTHLRNFETSLYQGSRRIPNVAIPNAAIPNIAILNVVIPNEVVSGEDGSIDQRNQPPYYRPLIGLSQIETANIDVEKTVRTKLL